MSVDKEPTGLVVTDGRRPDLLIHEYQSGLSACIHVTIVSSFTGNDCSRPGINAEAAEARKEAKYRALTTDGMMFVPFAMESVGGFGEKSIKLMETLGRNIQDVTDLPMRKAVAGIRNRLQFKWQRALGTALVSLARHIDHPYYGAF